LAFIPFAAEVPFEICIMPKNHKADFGSICDREKSDFASILKNVLTKLYEKLNDPDYNYVINTAARYKAEEPQVHWYCLIQPRLTTPAGFEMGSGISINPSLPEVDADYLNARESVGE
jgi:UDPglucose--hexose-1-phosphate uridylyltransferase